MGKRPAVITIAVDLDGTLAAYDGWRGLEHIGEPLPGAVKAMWALYQAGCELVIYTCRCGNNGRGEFAGGVSVQRWAEVVADWLLQHDFPPMHLHVDGGKPFADVYVDDRALRVAPQEDEGAWEKALSEIERMVKRNAGGD